MRVIQHLATIIIFGAAFMAGCFFFIAEHPWVDFSALTEYQTGKPSIVLDDQGNEWARFQLDKREPIKLKDVPRHVIQAFLAAEDRNFYEHAGISWRGIIRSVLINLYHRRSVQGASTITQQLVKLLFFDAQKTFTRKIKEQLLAIIVEQQFTKDQILENYLNHIYFGCGIYGIEAAAQRFWSKHVSELAIDEAATLAGIIRSPKKYCLLDHPQQAHSRRNVVLGCMLNANYIDQTTYEILLKKPLQRPRQEASDRAPHAREMIRLALEDLVGKHTLYSGGLTIQTTLNRSMQEHATTKFTKHLDMIKQKLVKQADGALICIDSKTGGIKSLIGGYQYKTSQFNRALQAHRQMGSIFKPFIYAAALEQGLQLTDIKIDQPISYQINNTIWEPKNSQKRFDGPMTVAYSLIRSNNSIPIQIILEMGTDKMIEYAKKCNIKSPIYPYPSLALGCIDSTPYEVVGMFNVFANKGVYVQPHLILWVKDQLGKKIWKYTPVTQPIMDWSISSQIAKLLMANIDYWKIWKKVIETSWPSCESFGKTGTTNDARSCWFAGSTPAYTTAVYIGCDDNQSMGKHVLSVRTALPLWADFNSVIEQPIANFSHDPRLKEIIVHRKTGEPMTDPQNPHALTLLITGLNPK